MCGIAGMVRVHPAGEAPPPEASILGRWLDILDDGVSHRGPDGAGRFRDRTRRADGAFVDVALVHRRLSIIDLEHGSQPMVSAGGELVRCGAVAGADRRGPPADGPLSALVFNGCLYNHRALRAELAAAGGCFSTDHSDTEALLRGWEAWGDAVLPRLDGMFAIACWDRRSATITLARDLAGEKPLFWAGPPDGTIAEPGRGWTIAFASSVAPLARLDAELGWSGRGPIDAAALASWVMQGFHDRPPARAVRAVAPGTRVRLGGAAVEAVRWAHLPARATAGGPGPGRIDDLIARSVRSRLEADVPLCCFLSGGVDSSLVAWHARRAAGSVRTFTVRMPDPRLDESAVAARAAALIGSVHETLPCDARPAEDLARLIPRLGLPLADSSLLPTHWVSRAAAGAAKVALGGDGGDELFSGYDRHRAARLLATRRAWPAAVPAGFMPRRDPSSRWSRAARLAEAARGRGYPDLVSVCPGRDFAALRLRVGGSAAAPEPSGGPVADAPRWDFDHYLPGDLLCKLDTASMDVPIEVRAPLLSRELIDAGLSASFASLAPGGQRKGLLRAAARRHLPADIVDRPKQGFAIPISDWLRNDFGGLRSLLLDTLSSAEPLGPPRLGLEIDRRTVDRWVAEHDAAGGRGWPWRGRDHGQRLYGLLTLALWARSNGA